MQIIGNENIVNFLDKSIANNTLAHSYIFSGPKNIGKKKTAYYIAAKLLNTEPDKLGLHADFMEAKCENNLISKEEVDGLISRLSLSSFGKGYKVLVINHAHCMNHSAANAFLKTLEEPPKRTLILLLTSELGKILPTIISRSCPLQFKLVSKEKVKAFLKNELKIEVTEKYANAAFGRPEKAIEMLKRENWEDEQINLIKEFDGLFFGNYNKRFKIIAELIRSKDEKKEKILEKIDFWTEILRDIILLKYQLNDAVVHQEGRHEIEIISERQPIKYFATLLERLIKMKGMVYQNINIQLMLENLII